MRLHLALLLAVCLSSVATMRADTPFSVPTFSGAVVDNAGMLSDGARQEISSALEQLYSGGGSQYAVLTVPDLGGEPIEQASIAVTDQWKLGKKGKDNGVLLMISKQDHRIRIEVGEGLEGDLTDAFCSRVIRETIVPLMREGRTDDAIAAGLVRLASISDPGVTLSGVPAGSADAGAAGPGIGFLGMIIIFFVVSRILGALLGGGGRRGGGMGFFSGLFLGNVLGGGFRGGGFGGGGFGGGGFGGGGGGGFSGGGASGGW